MSNLCKSAAVFLSLACMASPAPAQKPPGASPIEQLLNQCLQDGALRFVRDAKTGRPVVDPVLKAPQLALRDRGRLTEVLARHRPLLVKSVRDFLAGACKLSRKETAPVWVHLLATFGQEMKDDLALELAAHAAWRLNMPHAGDEELQTLKDITKAGVEAGVLMVDNDPRTGKARLLAKDVKKLGQLVADRRPLFRPEVRDALVAMTLRGVDHTVLIRAAGATLDDPRLRAFADYFEGRRLRQLNKVEEAAPCLERSSQAFEKLRDTSWQAAALSQLGDTYLDLADHERAARAYREGVRIFRVVHQGKGKDFGRLLIRLADACIAGGEYQPALQAYVEAMPVYLTEQQETRDEDFIEGASILQQFARIHARTGFPQDALEWHRNALSILKQVAEPDHPLIAHGLAALGELYLGQDEFEKAAPLLDRALALRVRKLGLAHPDTADSLRALAKVHIRRGEVGTALFSLEQAAAIYRDRFGTRHLNYAATLRELADLAVARKDDGGALRTIDRALRTQAADPDEKRSLFKMTADDFRPSRAVIELLRMRGDALLRVAKKERTHDGRLGFTNVALDAYRTAARLLDGMREAIAGESDRVQLAAEVAALYPRQLQALYQLHGLDPRAEYLESAFAVVEEGTARAFLQALGPAVARVKAGVTPALLAEEDQFLARLRAHDRQLAKLSGVDPEGFIKVMEQRRAAVRAYRGVKERIENEFPTLANLRSPRPCTVREAAACLAKNEAAVLYLVHEYHSFAVVLHSDGRLALVPLAGAAEIASAVAALTDFESLRLPSRVRNLARPVYDLLLAPLESALGDKDLVVVPSGPVCLVPLEILANDDGYVLEKRRVRYAPSLTVLHLVRQWDRNRARPDRNYLALGDPVYEADDVRIKSKVKTAAAPASIMLLSEEVSKLSDTSFPRLVHSGAEVQALARVLGADRGTVRLGLDATETSLKEESMRGQLARLRYLHLAVHGISGIRGLRQPALVLSLQQRNPSSSKDKSADGDDGYLELDEVMNLRLSADLVVLSACKSGLGPLHIGEGIQSLARAFQYAGSRGVICSLWSVDDQETATLMHELYGRLKNGRPTAEALREAKLHLLRAGRSPLFWGAFVLVGE